MLTKNAIMVIMAIARSKGGGLMKKLIILSDKVVYYARFSTKEEADAFNEKYMILYESEAKKLFEELKTRLFKNEKIPKLLNRRVDNNGIF